MAEEKKKQKTDGNDGISFDIVDSHTVERLVKNGDVELPKKKVDVPKDMRWNTKQLNSKLLQGILNGDSIPTIASSLSDIIGSNKASCIRNARTMVTGAECRGRQDSYEKLASRGVVQKKVWIATLDGRTRESHLEINGEEVDIDKKFSNGCMYPGDPSAPSEEVWNCRCSIRTHIVGFKSVDGSVKYVDGENAEEPETEIEERHVNMERMGEIDSDYPAMGLDEINHSKEAEKYRLDYVSQYTDNAAEAKEVGEALWGYGGNYEKCYFMGMDKDIRSRATEAASQKADVIQKFIDESPKYEGKIYRGLALDMDTANKFVEGAMFDEQKYAVSSWTTTGGLTSSFCKDGCRALMEQGYDRSDIAYVKLICDNSSSGTYVGNISPLWEKEVLVNNKGVSYVVDKVETWNGGSGDLKLINMNVYLKEVKK